MRSKSILVLAIILIVLGNSPIGATVVVTCEDLGGYEVELSYDATGESYLVRAFSLNITVSGGATIESIYDYKVGPSTADDPGYGIFEDGGIQIPDEGDVTEWGTPVVDPCSPGALPGLGTYGITIGMGALWDGDANAPLWTGTLFKFSVSAECDVTVVEEELYRGGIILEDGSQADLYSPPCHVFPEPTPPVADANGPYVIYVGDTLTLDASGSTDDDNDIVSYMWDLDDNGSFETDAGSQAIFDVNYTYLLSLGLLVDNTYNIHLKVTDSEQQSDTADSTLTIIPQPALQVAVDIKPGSCPNPLNVKSKGVLPLAILGSEELDVNEIVETSIQLAGVAAIRHSFEDVAAPAADTNDCNCTEDGPDGYLDLTLKFKTQEIVDAIGEVNDGDVLTLELTGVLYGERPIEGVDCVLIRGKFKPFNRADINKDGIVNMADFAILTEDWLQSSIVED